MCFRSELVAEDAFIAPTATIVGDVHIGSQASVWFGSVVRGDSETIRIGKQTNVQDGCILHADPGFPCVLGDRVTVGHAAIVHGATVEDDALIGMRAVVMNGAVIGSSSIVASGALVTEGTVIPPGTIAMGMPAKVVREATEADREYIKHAADHYVSLAERYSSCD